MTDFRTSSDKNVVDVNKVIEGFQISLQAEKEALYNLRFGIQRDNVDLHTSFSEGILQLQNDLAAENKIMDALAEQTQKTKVFQEKLKNASIDIAKLEEEKILVQGRNFEINQRLMHIVESIDAPFTDYVGQILNENLSLFFRSSMTYRVLRKARLLRNKGEKRR